VEELELVWVCCGWRTPPTAHSNVDEWNARWWQVKYFKKAQDFQDNKIKNKDTWVFATSVCYLSLFTLFTKNNACLCT
jgi:hypothetical protein